ncbi:MAG: penicillin-binding protein 2 [Clostridiales bacterium]
MDNKQYVQRRFGCFGFILALLFAGLLLRLLLLQIVQGEVLANDSSANSMRMLISAAPRGKIYTADGMLLADNQLVFAVAITASLVPDRQQLAERLAVVLQDDTLTATTILALLSANARRYEPTVIKRYTYEAGLPAISRVEENREQLPGVVIIEEAMRRYPQGTMAGQLIGAVGAISEQEYSEKQDQGYLITDWLGKSGLEKTMEQRNEGRKSYGLRGRSGLEQVEVTAAAEAVRTVYRQEPLPGDNLQLTIAGRVQQVMEESLARVITAHGEKNPKCGGGAAVLLDINSGAVLAMASYPLMNPNDFTTGLSEVQAEYYWDERLTPSLNRAVAAAYPPGSIFKPVTALAGLSSGVSVDDTVYCGSSVWRNSGKARCTAAHGNIGFYTAMARSCNSYFQEMGAIAGIDNIDSIARQLGFGQLTGIELTGEVAGVLPTPQWKAERFSGWEKDWHPYDTWYTAIGQGYTTATPLQMAAYIAAVAHNGQRMQPYVVEAVVNAGGQTLWRHQVQAADNLAVEPQLIDQVCRGMLAAASSGGTAYGAMHSLPIAVGAKTGTAQTGLPGDGKNDAHGVFVAFAPYEKPQVAFACVIEYGQSGSSTAAYVCRDVLMEYFGE